MRVLVATVRVPFVDGGAEYHARALCRALNAEGHEAETIAIPFKWYPPQRILDHILACRLLDVTESAGVKVDRLIGLKFPAYLMPHPHKILWILHQHRQAYELWDHELGDLIHYPDGLQIRDAIREADARYIPEARAIFGNSQNVCDRLKRYTGIPSLPLHHPPPDAEQFYCREDRGYLFFPSRIWPPKRHALLLEALAWAREPVRVRIAGSADDPAFARRLESLAAATGVSTRVEWLGRIDEERKWEEYAHARAVVYPPFDEDYGYVTLESMLAGKPVVTCTDSGGPLEFVQPGRTGLVVDPDARALAAALDRIWRDPEGARAMGVAARALYDELGISWKNVVQALLA